MILLDQSNAALQDRIGLVQRMSGKLTLDWSNVNAAAKTDSDPVAAKLLGEQP